LCGTDAGASEAIKVFIYGMGDGQGRDFQVRNEAEINGMAENK
jgi:hypothetical protein